MTVTGTAGIQATAVGVWPVHAAVAGLPQLQQHRGHELLTPAERCPLHAVHCLLAWQAMAAVDHARADLLAGSIGSDSPPAGKKSNSTAARAVSRPSSHGLRMGRTTRRAAVSTEDEEPSSAEEEDEEEEEHSSSGEESSGEEDSGDEQLKRKPATAEGPTGAQKREAHQRALREAKAANAKAGKSRDKAAIAKAKTVELEKARLAKQRVEFLLSVRSTKAVRATT